MRRSPKDRILGRRFRPRQRDSPKSRREDWRPLEGRAYRRFLESERRAARRRATPRCGWGLRVPGARSLRAGAHPCRPRAARGRRFRERGRSLPSESPSQVPKPGRYARRDARVRRRARTLPTWRFPRDPVWRAWLRWRDPAAKRGRFRRRKRSRTRGRGRAPPFSHRSGSAPRMSGHKASRSSEARERVSRPKGSREGTGRREMPRRPTRGDRRRRR